MLLVCVVVNYDSLFTKLLEEQRIGWVVNRYYIDLHTLYYSSIMVLHHLFAVK